MLLLLLPNSFFGNRHRSFQHRWLSLYNGEVYSGNDEGGYCKYCFLFGQYPYSVSALASCTLATKPLKNLKKASDKLCRNWKWFCSQVSSDSNRKSCNFIAMMERKQLPVDQQL